MCTSLSRFYFLATLNWNLNISAYVLPIKVGKNEQTFSLQVDTGSSDLVCIFGLLFFSHLLHSFLLTLFRLPNFFDVHAGMTPASIHFSNFRSPWPRVSLSCIYALLVDVEEDSPPISSSSFSWCVALAGCGRHACLSLRLLPLCAFPFLFHLVQPSHLPSLPSFLFSPTPLLDYSQLNSG